jgi:hypothetical protein
MHTARRRSVLSPTTHVHLYQHMIFTFPICLLFILFLPLLFLYPTSYPEFTKMFSTTSFFYKVKM